MSFDEIIHYVPDGTIKNRAGISKRPIQDEVLLALEKREVPQRYKCNANLLTVADQGRLAVSRVVLVGCGGIAEQVLEFLVQIGVGRITVYDPEGIMVRCVSGEVRTDSSAQGELKVDMLCRQAAERNPLVSVQAVAGRLHQAGLQEAKVIVDCLTDHSLRGVLQDMASNVKTPLVSASISEWTVLATTTWQKTTGLKDFMGNDFGKKYCENAPAFLKSFAASIQVMEVLRILTDASSVLNGNLLMLNLSELNFSTISLQTNFEY
jgi:adenylyltransferase/sulfurtransferase